MTGYGETVATGAEHPGTCIGVLESAAGWYIGYQDADGMPYTRESEEYWPNMMAAQRALEMDEWHVRGYPKDHVIHQGSPHPCCKCSVCQMGSWILWNKVTDRIADYLLSGLGDQHE